MARRFRRSVWVGVAATVAAAWGSSGAWGAADQGPAVGAQNGVVKVRIAGAGTVTSSPAGLDCPAARQPCEASFPIGTAVTLAARGDTGTPGWVWHVWDLAGPCANVNSATCSFTVDRSFVELGVTFVGINYGGPRVNARWRGTTLLGTIVVGGATSHATNIAVTLIAPSGRQRTFQSTIPAPGGSFTRSFPLPRTGFPPGQYTVRLDSFVTGRQMPAQSYRVTLPPPPLGFVTRAWVSSIGSRAAVRRLPSRSPGATAHFVFSHRPRAGARITTSWALGGRRLGTVRKSPAREVLSSVILPGGLPNGRYTCVLRVGGVVLATVTVRIG